MLGQATATGSDHRNRQRLRKSSGKGKIKAFAVTKTSAALWLGKQGNDELQRVYGITFPDKKAFAKWKRLRLVACHM